MNSVIYLNVATDMERRKYNIHKICIKKKRVTFNKT